jgi:drug/metabolite transporter (DMT)-like permease
LHTNHRQPLRGYLYIASAAFLWGVAANLGRAAFTGRLLPQGQTLRPINPLILSQSRTTFSFVILLLALLLFRGLPTPDLLRMFVLGILGVAASNYLYYLAIQRTNVATAIILQYTAPVWVLLYTIARGMQKPTLQRIRPGHWNFRFRRISSRHNWSTGSTDSGILIRLLQYRRTQHPCPL